MRLQLESIVINKNLNFDLKIYYNLLTAYDMEKGKVTAEELEKSLQYKNFHMCEICFLLGISLWKGARKIVENVFWILFPFVLNFDLWIIAGKTTTAENDSFPIRTD